MVNQLGEVLVKLLMRTKDGAVDWASSADPNEFRVKLGDNLVCIEVSHDDDYPDQPDYFLRVRTPAGRVVEEASNRELSNPPHSVKPNATMVMEELFRLARRKAMGVDDRLRSILDELDDTPF
jgi:hypothetical protein